MNGNGEESAELELKAGDKSIRAKSKYMAELVSLVMTAAFSTGAFLFYHHDRRSDELFKELVETNRQMIKAQREMNCLIAIPQERREVDFQTGFCKRISQ